MESDLSADPSQPAAAATGLSGLHVALLSVACGLIAADPYFAQPLIKPIARDLGLSPALGGLIGR